MTTPHLQTNEPPLTVRPIDPSPPVRPQFSLQSPRSRSMLMALVGGLVMSLAPAPLNWWGLAWIGLIPLWLAIVGLALDRVPRSRWAMLLPILLWSLAYHGISLSWITGLHPLTWMGMSWLASVAIVAFAWAFITFWGVASVGLWAGGMVWLCRLGIGPWGRVLGGTALWCLVETLRSQTALDWTALAYTQSPGNPVILHLGQLSGNLTVTAAIVAVNGLLAEAWRSRTESRRWWRRLPKNLTAAAIGLLVVAHIIGGWLYLKPLEDVAANALEVGIVQGNIPTREKLFATGIKQAFSNYDIGYRLLAKQGVDAVLTSEGAIPFSWQRRKPTPLDAAIQELKTPMWLGSFGLVGDNQPTQRLFSLDHQGQIIGQYDKVKLVPLGESLPFEPILGKLIGRLSPLRAYLQPGAVGQRFETGYGLAAVGICYESAFPELFRVQIKQGAEFLITASNLDPYSEVLMAQHQAHDLMRSIEFDRWAVRATNTGYSGFIDPHGRVIWRSSPREWVAHAARIYRRQTLTPYAQLGNWFTPVLLLGTGGLIWRGRQLS
jgi:apolipoprotein N-acyltransferase